ncbi:Gfo/Idh/MocA family protein [uncultured Olegusella sp.]|uniref:Gfo/Idh/MocA family protein n=1 Tax=uncultured Olegusella sp. TaxID=1979846 RepID=UPI00261C5421|nr:Gfo/Idh/MocA family oxidoreductase [uncultured Olegusella sp.]
MGRELRIATIGTSAICERFLDAVAKTEGVCLAGCYSRTLDRAKDFAQKHGAELAFDDLAELASSPDVDAVYIASPNALHGPQAKQLIAEGKHVLVEKAFASNAAEAAEVFAAAKAAGVIAMEAMRNLYDPGFAKIEQNLDRLGTIRQATFRFSKITSRMARLRAGERINQFDPLLSEGALMDIGIYTMEPAIAFFGRPERVLAAGICMAVPGEPLDSAYGKIDLAGEVLLDYGDKVVNLSFGKVTDDLIPSQIQGETATLTIGALPNCSQLKLVTHVDAGMAYGTVGGTEEELPVVTPENDMVCELSFFRDAVARKAEALKRVHQFQQVTYDALTTMDEARRQLGVRFPADK